VAPDVAGNVYDDPLVNIPLLAAITYDLPNNWDIESVVPALVPVRKRTPESFMVIKVVLVVINSSVLT
jgi:hypothetical protein